MMGVGTEYSKLLDRFYRGEECDGCKATQKRLDAMGPVAAWRASLFVSHDVVMRYYTVTNRQWLYFVPGAHWASHLTAWLLLVIAIDRSSGAAPTQFELWHHRMGVA